MKYAVVILLIILLILLNDHYQEQAKDSVFIINGGIFDQDVHVVITEDTSFARKYVFYNLDSTVSSKDFDARGVTFCSIDGKSPIIWLPNTKDTGVINHELLHASVDILNWAGIELNEETEEVYAYQLQYLTNQFYNHIK